MIACWHCGFEFQPKPGGHNARYCSVACKGRVKSNRTIYNPDARKRAYASTLADPERYARHLAQGRAGRAVARNWLADYKLERGCVDCGFREHHSALQLDHEGVKTISIANARSSLVRLQREIRNGKCVVRCANCHAMRTWERKQHGVTPTELHAMADGESLDRRRLDIALVALTFAVDDLCQAVARMAP